MATLTHGPAESDAPSDSMRRVRAIIAGSSGNLVEWYDFYTYAAFALYFASSFFPGDDPVVQQFVQGRPGHQLELLAKWALEVDICLDVHRSAAHHDAVPIGVGTVRDGHW